MPKIPIILLFLVLILFSLTQVNGLFGLFPGDEHVYYKMADLISHGSLPYRDFLYSHPPLHLWMIAPIVFTFGTNILILKAATLLTTLLSAFFLYLTVKGKGTWQAGITSVVLFLFSFEVLSKATFTLGVQTTLLWISLGYYFLTIKKRYWISGICFGLASLVRLYALIPFIVIGAVVAINNKAAGRSYLLGFLAAFLPLNLTLAYLYGGDYLNNVFFFHTLKTREFYSTLKVFGHILSENWYTIAPALFIFFSPKQKRLQLPLIVSITYLLFLLALPKVFEYYFIPLLYFISIISGQAIIQLAALPRRDSILIVSSFGILAIWAVFSHVIFLEKVGFSPFTPLDPLQKSISQINPKRGFLFGDHSITPLLSILTKREIAGNFVDTNNLVFSTKIANIGQILEEITFFKDSGLTLILRDSEGLLTLPEVREYVKSECQLKESLFDRAEGWFFVYDCSY